MRVIVCTRCGGDYGIQHCCPDGTTLPPSTVIWEPDFPSLDEETIRVLLAKAHGVIRAHDRLNPLLTEIEDSGLSK